MIHYTRSSSHSIPPAHLVNIEQKDRLPYCIAHLKTSPISTAFSEKRIEIEQGAVHAGMLRMAENIGAGAVVFG